MPQANTVQEYEELIAAQYDSPNFVELDTLFNEMMALKASEKADADAAGLAETDRKIKVRTLLMRVTGWRSTQA